MAGPKVPAGWELEGQPIAAAQTSKPAKVPAGWELEQPAQQTAPVAEPGSPLERALAEQTGDVVTVDTPTGPAKFTRSGARFFDADEAAQMQEAGGARLKERALEGGLSFLSGGGPFLDEMAGAAKAMAPNVRGSQILDTYRQGRDSARADVARSTRNASPEVSVGDIKIPVLPALGAAAPSLMAPLPAGWLGRIASSAAQGGEAAAGATDADLTQGEGRRFLAEVGKGTGIGALAAGGAEALSAPVRVLGNLASREAGAAKQAVTAATQAAKDKALKSATSSMGGVASGGGNSLETLTDILKNPHLHHPDVVARATAMYARPEIQEAVKRAGMSNLDKLERFIPAYDAAEGVTDAARTAAQPAAVASEVAAKTAPEAITGDLLSKGWRSVGQHAALGALGSTAGAGVSWLAGEDPKAGAALGATAGFLSQGVLQFARNQAKSPVVQYGANSLIEKLLREGAGATAGAAKLVSPVSQASRPDPLERDRTAIQAFISGG